MRRSREDNIRIGHRKCSAGEAAMYQHFIGRNPDEEIYVAIHFRNGECEWRYEMQGAANSYAVPTEWLEQFGCAPHQPHGAELMRDAYEFMRRTDPAYIHQSKARRET